jgi:SAM-dependent methyltransferase
MEYNPAGYGDLWDEIYDDEHAANDPSAAVAFLADLADGGRVLELGIGTGRIALPLSELGVTVTGVDSSSAMVQRLQRKAGGRQVEVLIGDMASCELGGPYRLAFVAFNTIFTLADQESQFSCFRNVVRALEPDGRFVVECFVPDPERFRDGDQAVRAIPGSSSQRFRLNVSLHSPIEQRVESDVWMVRDGRIEVLPITLRYIWPSEMDLMAQLAGLDLDARFGNWERGPFGAFSTSHVSVYRLRP